MGKNQWVVLYDNQWAVRGEGNKRVTKIFKTQQEAKKFADKIGKNQKSELIIQDRHGKIISKDSYGNDPKSIKDTEH